jgi:hypothetical protein
MVQTAQVRRESHSARYVAVPPIRRVPYCAVPTAPHSPSRPAPPALACDSSSRPDPTAPLGLPTLPALQYRPRRSSIIGNAAVLKVWLNSATFGMCVAEGAKRSWRPAPGPGRTTWGFDQSLRRLIPAASLPPLPESQPGTPSPPHSPPRMRFRLWTARGPLDFAGDAAPPSITAPGMTGGRWQI